MRRTTPSPSPSLGPTVRRAAAVGALAALAVAVPAGLAGAATSSASNPAPPATTVPATTVTLAGAGFEQGLTGWTTTGDTAAAKTEGSGHASSSGRLTHWAADAYDVTTSQTVHGLASGWWTASAWVKSGGGLDATHLSLTGCGIDDTVAVPVTEQDDQWVRVAVSAYVTAGDCTVAVNTDGPGGAWASVDDVTLERGEVERTVRGGDLSGVAKNEDRGAAYSDADGTAGDPVEILADAGMNLGRLKVWVDPSDGYNEVTHVVESARRIEAAGMQLLVDFHYSDRWTDPGAQAPPAAWLADAEASDDPAAVLTQHVYDHTHEVMTALADAGIAPDYVQVGNEINPGMMAPYGQTWSFADSSGAHWDDLAAFLTAGHDAVKDVSPSTRTILHLTNINNGIGSLTWWFDEVTARAVPFDVIGLSYYGYWHGSLGDLQNAVTTLSDRYDKDVMVVETAYPFTLDDDSPAWENVISTTDELVPGYPATVAGQAAAFRAVQDVVAAAPGGRGLGAVYWEPAWTSVAGNGWDPDDATSGNAWENQALFGFDGRLLASASALAPDHAAAVWSRAATYGAGDTVVADGRVWTASWWTRGQTPGDANGPWQEITAGGTTGWAPWVASRTYVAGDRVTRGNVTFVAQWWTRNQAPGDPNGPWKAVES